MILQLMYRQLFVLASITYTCHMTTRVNNMMTIIQFAQKIWEALIVSYS